MQIQLKCSCGEGSCHEWAIIELQGVVEVQPGFQDQLQNLEIGRLCRSSQDTYTFTVGYHELTGSKVPLKKPLLVLKKIKCINVEDSANINWSNRSKVELEVIGIIRHRILFKTRPKALISRVNNRCMDRTWMVVGALLGFLHLGSLGKRTKLALVNSLHLTRLMADIVLEVLHVVWATTSCEGKKPFIGVSCIKLIRTLSAYILCRHSPAITVDSANRP